MKKSIIISTTIIISIVIILITINNKINNYDNIYETCKDMSDKKFEKAKNEKDIQIICTCGDYNTFSINLLEMCVTRKELINKLK